MSKKVSKQRKTRERGLNVKITEDSKKSKSGAVRVNNNFDQKKSAKKPTKRVPKKSSVVAPKKGGGVEVDARKASAKKPAEELAKKSEELAKTSEELTRKLTEESAKKPAEASVRKPELQDLKAEPEKTVETTVGKTVESKTPEESSLTAKPVKLPASFSRNSAESFADMNWAEPKGELKDTSQNTPEVAPKASPNDLVKDAPTNVLNTSLAAEDTETLALDTSAIEQYSSRIVIRDVEQIMPENETALYQESSRQNFNIGNSSLDNHGMGLRAEVQTTLETPKPAPAKELKEREIAKAVRSASKLPKTKNKRRRFSIDKIGWPRMVLAISCMATAVFAVAYFINLSASDMSIKVAAMQSGIEASYPGYIPRGYNLADVTSTSGKVVLRFKYDESEYVISEENSTWDSNALLVNYIKPEYGDDYTAVKEQGLTLYMGSRWEAWVNGGKLYKLNVLSGSLTKKQLKTIATSL